MLRALGLARNSLCGAAGAGVVARALLSAGGAALERVDVSCNGFGIEGAKVLVAALKGGAEAGGGGSGGRRGSIAHHEAFPGAKLEVVDARHNGIREGGGEPLFRWLAAFRCAAARRCCGSVAPCCSRWLAVI